MTDEPLDRDENVDPEEIRLMAYLLDELDGDDKYQIEERLTSDAAFAKKRDELEQAAAFMKEASAIDLRFEDESAEPFQLSKERRDSIFKEKPKKRSRLLTFNFNHPLIPVAVAASFLIILFSDRIVFFRDGIFDSATSESREGEYIFQSAPPLTEREELYMPGAFNNSISTEGDRLRASIIEKEELLKAKFQERKEILESGGSAASDRLDTEIESGQASLRELGSRYNQHIKDLENSRMRARGIPVAEPLPSPAIAQGKSKQDGAIGSAGEEMSAIRLEASKRRLSKTRYFEDVSAVPQNEINNYAQNETLSPVVQHAPQSQSVQSIENTPSELDSSLVEVERKNEFKFSVDPILPAKKGVPDLRQEEQDFPALVNAPLKIVEELERGILEGRNLQGAETAATGEDDEVFELSPFSVDASDDVGYRSTSTLGGSRLNSSLSDVGSSLRAGVGYKANSIDTLPFLHDSSMMIQESVEDTGGRGLSSGTANSKEVVSFIDPDLNIPAPVDDADGRQVGATVGRISGDSADEPVAGGFADASAIGWDYNVAKNPEFGNLDLVGDLLASSELPKSLTEIQAPQIERDPGEEKRAEADKEVAPAKSNPALVEYPEYLTKEVPQSTFSLNVSDVSFRLTQSYLNNRQLPVAGTLRTEEFINAFDYGDPEPTMEESIGFSWERARWPYAHGKDVLRFSLKTAAAGRLDSQPMNLVLAIDSSGSMSRVDRIAIVEEILANIGQELQPSDTVSVIGFSQDARLILDSISSDSSERLGEVSSQLNPRGGTDLEAGLRLAYETAVRTFRSGAVNRIILFTDGAANLGNTVAEDLTELVEENRQAGIALDSFGIGFDGHNDVMLERLSRNGDGRYRFLRTVDEVRTEFGENLLGSLRPAANDVKVQVEFNPDRVRSYQLLGYQQHQLRSEDFRNNAVDAAEIGAAEAGNALYLVDIDDSGTGDLGVVRARYRDAVTGDYEERSWSLPYSRNVPDLAEAPASMRLAAVAAGFAALLNESPLAADIEFQSMINLSQDLQDFYPLDPEVIALPNLLLRAQQLSGRQ